MHHRTFPAFLKSSEAISIWYPDLCCAATEGRQETGKVQISFFCPSCVSSDCDQILICQVKSFFTAEAETQTLNQGKLLTNQQDHKSMPKALLF